MTIRSSMLATIDIPHKPPLIPEWAGATDDAVIGKDILELVSSAMYIDPITIYREYVQNSADAIDQARAVGLLEEGSGRVEIEVSANTRSVRIRDNGIGLTHDEFAKRLLAFGASPKRGSGARGFRGIGRLGGVAYCQELIFRSRTSGERAISELRWDCKLLKSLLRNADSNTKLTSVVRQVVSQRRVFSDCHPDHFFEVELSGVVRHRSDRLLNVRVISDYLAQVAPVPFSTDFPFAREIVTALRPHIPAGGVHIQISGIDRPILRPHGSRLEMGNGDFSNFTELELREIPSVNGETAAIVWILHNGYTGVIPNSNLVKGLRFRTGNIQVGDHALLEDLFPESRFNAWSVGEIHIIDKQIIPNARRDHFEQNAHYQNLLNHLFPLARDISRRCRMSSINRKRLRDFEMHYAAAQEKIDIIAQGTLPAKARSEMARAAERSIAALEKVAGLDGLDVEPKNQFKIRARRMRVALERATGTNIVASPLDMLPANKRRMYEHLFSLVYECSVNRVAAKALVDRILLKIA